MFSRSWCAAIALGLTLSFSLALAQVSPESQPESSKQNQGTTDNIQSDKSAPKDQSPTALIPSLDKIEAAIRDLKPRADKAEDEQKTKREEADLQAQKDMADWARRMFWATVLSVIAAFLGVAATGVGIYLIWKTLGETKRAADSAADMAVQAREATQAAFESADLARKQLYPIVKVAPIGFVPMGGCPIRGSIVNHGPTAISGVRIDARMRIFGSHSSANKVGMTSKVWISNVLAGDPTREFECTSNDFDLDSDDFFAGLTVEQVNAEAFHVRVVMIVTYSDIFLVETRIKWVLKFGLGAKFAESAPNQRQFTTTEPKVLKHWTVRHLRRRRVA